MAKISKTEIDALNQLLTINIEKADYEGNFNKELKKYRKDANLKGFRKGMAPMNYVKKIFGKQLLAEEINKTLQEQLGVALKDVKIFGDPMPNETQEPVDFNPMKLQDYEFKFDLGLIAEFELAGVDANESYDGYRVKVSDKVIEEQFTNAQKRFGERSVIEDGNIEAKDLVKVAAKELDGKEVKEGGHTAEFSIPVDQSTEELAKALMTKKKGDTIQLNVHDVETESTKEIVRQYVLGIDKDDETVGEMFECEIIEVSRVELAEVNQEFFDKQFGEGVVASETEAKDKIRIDMNKSIQKNAEAILFRDIQEKLIEKNSFALPEEFLKRWIKFSNENEVTNEQIEREFPLFSKELRWSVIKGKLIEKFDLKVTEEEVQGGFINAIRSYGGMPAGMDDSILVNYAQRMMQDEKAVRKQAEDIMGNKLFEAITAAITVVETDVDEKEMEKIITEANKKQDEDNAKYAAVAQENAVEA